MDETFKHKHMSRLSDVVEATASTGRKLLRLFSSNSEDSKDIESPTTISSTSDSCSTTTTFFEEPSAHKGFLSSPGFPGIGSNAVLKCDDPFDSNNSPVSPFSAVSALRNDCAIIVDWDDTLFPSSWLQGLYSQRDPYSPDLSNGMLVMKQILDGNLLRSEDIQTLKIIESSVLNLLREMRNNGEVYILTNAESGWVQFSASVFVPEVYRFLADEEVPIVSARSCFSKMKMFPTYESTVGIINGEIVNTESPEPDQWKTQTLSLLLQSFMEENAAEGQTSPSWKQFHFISIGDSDCERRALLACREQYYTRGFFKSIKLIENPDPSQLKRQQDYLKKSIGNLRTIQDCIDIVFETSA